MPGDTARASPFLADSYELANEGLWLSAISPSEAAGLGQSLAVIDPWVRYGMPGQRLAAQFAAQTSGAARLAIRKQRDASPIGVIMLRNPWLAGPYLQFLGLLPEAQGMGYGSAVLRWFEAEARTIEARNIWICTSAFNEGALRLYLRFGFVQIATLDELMVDGTDEILLRKRLGWSSHPQR